MNNNYLVHHGILGQKWGVRRFQPYPKGHTGGKEIREAAKNKKSLQKHSETEKKNDVKYRGTLTYNQLKKKIERLNMEKQLRELTENEIYPGRAAAKRAINQIGSKVATTAISGATLYAMKAAVSKEFDAKELGNAIFNGGAKKK